MSSHYRRHHRRSIRLRGYDYRQTGAYYLTILVERRRQLFGSISATGLELSAAGQMAIAWLTELPNKFPQVTHDAYVMMPDHIHMIIVLEEISQQAAEQSPLPTLGDVVGWYKTMTTNAYILGVRQQQWPPFAGRLWHRNYYEHIVRDDADLARIRSYIANNVSRWQRKHCPTDPSTPP